MWTTDATQHIHVEASIPESEVLARATEVAQSSNKGQTLLIDLIEAKDFSCRCMAPADWKTYLVIIHVLVEDGQTTSGPSNP